MGGLEKTLQGLRQHFSPLPPQVIIISDFEKVENKTTNQPIEVEQLANFSSKLVQGGFFEVELNSLDIHVVVPTKMWSKCMMKRKGKGSMEEGSSPAKVTQKQTST
jgi:hypothetical protein